MTCGSTSTGITNTNTNPMTCSSTSTHPMTRSINSSVLTGTQCIPITWSTISAVTSMYCFIVCSMLCQYWCSQLTIQCWYSYVLLCYLGTRNTHTLCCIFSPLKQNTRIQFWNIPCMANSYFRNADCEYYKAYRYIYINNEFSISFPTHCALHNCIAARNFGWFKQAGINRKKY